MDRAAFDFTAVFGDGESEPFDHMLRVAAVEIGVAVLRVDQRGELHPAHRLAPAVSGGEQIFSASPEAHVERAVNEFDSGVIRPPDDRVANLLDERFSGIARVGEREECKAVFSGAADGFDPEFRAEFRESAPDGPAFVGFNMRQVEAGDFAEFAASVSDAQFPFGMLFHCKSPFLYYSTGLHFPECKSVPKKRCFCANPA